MKKKEKLLTTAQSLYKVVQHVLTLMFLLNLGKILNCGSISMEPFLWRRICNGAGQFTF